MSNARPGARGFTLIEAMVAMVIIAGAGMALFSWINASVMALRRVEDANARNSATLNAIEYMQTVNPMLTPQGHMQLGDYQVDWVATAQTAVTDGSDYPRGISLFQFALYDTVVKVERADGSYWFDFKLKLVGYKKVRETVRSF